MSSVDVVLPKLGESITTATIIKWLKSEGDFVREDEPLFEVTTDKVNSEIPAPCSGIIQSIDFRVDEEVAVGQRVCVLGSKGQEEYPKKDKQRLFLTPVVKKLVAKYGINVEDLGSISGTGVNNRITKVDIEKFLEKRVAKCTQVSPARKTMIRNLEKVSKEVPSASMMIQLDMTNIVKAKEQKITPAAAMIWMLGRVLGDFPKLFSSYSNERIEHNKEINVGVAINSKDELFVPVVRSVESLSLVGVVKELARLKQLAISKKLTPQDMCGANCTLTNFGMGGVDIGVPMLPLGQTMILGLGAIKKTVVVEEHSGVDHMVIKNMAYLSLTFDHRVVDGMYVSSFFEKFSDFCNEFV